MPIPKDKPEEGRILDGLRITQDSHKVNIHIEEPEELVEYALSIFAGAGVGAGEINRPPQNDYGITAGSVAGLPSSAVQ